jgi:hypothetical protein
MNENQAARVDQARQHLEQARRAFAQNPTPGLASAMGRLQRYIRRNSVVRWNVEFTDTFGGEANYCFVRRFSVMASTMRGAARVAARHLGYSGRIASNGQCGRWDVRGAALCFFIDWHDDTRPGEGESYPCVNAKGE